jgi:hypothetical protein
MFHLHLPLAELSGKRGDQNENQSQCDMWKEIIAVHGKQPQ